MQQNVRDESRDQNKEKNGQTYLKKKNKEDKRKFIE